jgi:hypothetical protein
MSWVRETLALAPHSRLLLNWVEDLYGLRAALRKQKLTCSSRSPRLSFTMDGDCLHVQVYSYAPSVKHNSGLKVCRDFPQILILS